MHAVPAFTVSGDDVADGKMMDSAQVYEGFGCTGGNLAPQLSWKNVPAGTKSLAVTVYDPGAPAGSGFFRLPTSPPPRALRHVSASAMDYRPVSCGPQFKAS